ncbi:MAG: hypothetical protein SGJ07_15850 [Rhodospirillaceae bacterium]|nr:hypothetical protein [Rhodospirillaceae bacterium]
MHVEIIPPGEQPAHDCKRNLRRRIMVWCAIVAAVAIAIGILAVGFIVLAIAAVIGIAAGILLTALRWFDRQRGNKGSSGGFNDPRGPSGIEIVTLPRERPGAGRPTPAPDRSNAGDIIDRPPDR